MSTRAKIVKQLSQRGYPKRQQHKPQIREAAKKTKWNILRGDQVQVISRAHPEYGKQGIVTFVDRDKDRVIVENVNLGKKYVKANPDLGLPGKQLVKERSMHYSNVNLVDPVTGKPTRVYRKYLDDGTKVRVSKRSGAIIPRPDILSQRKRPMAQSYTESCTSNDDDVWKVTYDPAELMRDMKL